MTRNLKLAFLASTLLLAAPGCLGGYQPGQAGTDPMPPVNSGNAGGGGGGGGGSAGSGGGGGSADGGVTTPPPPSSAKPMFDANVAPVLMAKCGNTACHGGTASSPPPFAAGAAATMYATTLNYTSVLFPGFDRTTAQILLKIAPGNHNGAVYTATEASNIGQWLDAEKAARAGGGGTASPADALLAKFSGCMQLTEFTSANFAQKWGQKQATTGQCQECHTTGGNGFLANQDSPTMFSRLMQKNPFGGYFLQDYYTVDTTDPANPKMTINTALLMREGGGYAQHGTFNTTTNDPAMQVLQSYFDTTMAHLTAGTCGPSQLAQ